MNARARRELRNCKRIRVAAWVLLLWLAGLGVYGQVLGGWVAPLLSGLGFGATAVTIIGVHNQIQQLEEGDDQP